MRAERPHTHAPKGKAGAREASAATIQRKLASAQQHCETHGGQLTDLRRDVFELLLRRNGVAKAYDLQEDLAARRGRVAPMTVYRALDFLVDQGLVHRVDANNSFVACDGEHDHHASVMLVCTQCGQVTEWHDDATFAGLQQQLAGQAHGFAAQSIEIKGVCRTCREAA